jgi:hypothetical protein
VILLLRTDRTQAYLLKDLLGHHGIKAHVFNANMSSIVGDIPPDQAWPQVWLDDDADRARAERVLRDHLAACNRQGVVFCRACREENPATFELCWHCGTAL